ncbi:MAG: UDP-N-acetylmuramoyl-L-alanyl-D-glutamate--2,6-diaminopimelate ligase [Chitinophagaceae bacterium]|nr:MAG: UDP-N-acetylmuramoyl-L-alanyl-D-glutamate--2,6-diaminopimelate ligase [Chitinophagaceae bacterium]
MKLQDLLYKVRIQEIIGSSDIEVLDVQIDSRQVKDASLFIALHGSKVDGNAYINDAIKKGALVIVADQLPETINNYITYVKVDDAATAAGIIASNFYGNPSHQLKVVGVTGTNGKTTIATLLYNLFTKLGHRCGLISTVQNIVVSDVLPSTHTTPDVINLQKLLAQMLESQCEYVFMEVSSHAIHQKRIEGLDFKGAIFSNITHDHLDYHKTFDEYIKVKKAFFDGLSKDAFAITNIDDKRGDVMLQNTKAIKKTYSLKSMSDFKGKVLDNSFEGLHMMVDDREVFFKLIGSFNAYNLLAVYAAAQMLGVDKNDVLVALSNIDGAVGRFDYIVSPKQNVIAIIDYAHTPDALENVLQTIKDLRKGFEQVITVVGCGGDRDPSKRPIMGNTAAQLSDKIIITSDNPRTEDPAEIIKQIEAGVVAADRRKCISIADRKEAIKTAINLANANDIILVAGKGHETYQDINGVKHHFDDKEIVNEFFNFLEQ